MKIRYTESDMVSKPCRIEYLCFFVHFFRFPFSIIYLSIQKYCCQSYMALLSSKIKSIMVYVELNLHVKIQFYNMSDCR
jgi:hypothetical protein